MSYERKLSPNERLFLCLDKHSPPYDTPCTNQMVLEGVGPSDESAWRNAVKKASLANPGSRIVLKGKLGFARWVDSGKTTPFRIVDGGNWDGRSEINAEFLSDPLPAYQGPTSEVLLVKCKNTNYVIFRSHHAAMDGRGTEAFAEDVFRVLNNKPPQGENSMISDIDLCRQITTERCDREGDEVRAPTGFPEGDDPGRTWYRKTIKGKFSQILAKVAIAIARSARLYGETDVRFRIPVDLRPRVEGLRSTANLSGAIIMNVEKETTPASWKKLIKEQLTNKTEAVIPRVSKHIPIPVGLIFWMTLKVLKKDNLNTLKKRMTTGQYQVSGLISNLGLIPLDRYSGGGFEASSIFFIPPDFNPSAFFLTITGNKNGLELALRVPKVLASGGRLHKVLDDIESFLRTGEILDQGKINHQEDIETPRQTDSRLAAESPETSSA